MKTVKYPSSLRSITVRQYQQFVAVVDGMEDKDEIDRELVGNFCNIDSRLIDKLSGKQFTKLRLVLNELLGRKYNLQHTFELNGVTYGFIPDLENATFGEWADIDSYLQDISNAHKFLAVVFRPITEARKGQYTIEEYDGTGERAEIMLDAPLDVMLGAYTFFLDLGMALLKTIPSYLEDQMASKKVQHTIKDLDKNGDGTDVSINSLTETLVRYKMLVDSLSERHSHTSLSH